MVVGGLKCLSLVAGKMYLQYLQRSTSAELGRDAWYSVQADDYAKRTIVHVSIGRRLPVYRDCGRWW